jgi:hypothetical protein
MASAVECAASGNSGGRDKPGHGHLGCDFTGVAQESGGIEWNFGRKRGLEI